MNKLNRPVQGLAEISLRVHDLSPSPLAPLPKGAPQGCLAKPEPSRLKTIIRARHSPSILIFPLAFCGFNKNPKSLNFGLFNPLFFLYCYSFKRNSNRVR